MLRRINNFITSIDFTSRGLFVFFLVYLALSSLIVVTDYGVFVKTPIVILNYIVVLGALLTYAVGIKFRDDELTFAVLSVGMSVAGLMIWGLIINFTLPLFGILKPFSAVPLVSSLFILLAVLGYFTFNRNRDGVLKLGGFRFKYEYLFALIPVFILLISLLGTGSLNNTGNNYLLLFLYPSIALYFAYLFLSKKEFPNSVYFSVIYFSALALLFTFSLRGPNILGWDVNEEYQVFTGTLENLRWSMSLYKGLDYNACISITILPTIFKVLTGISSQYIFKLVFQMLFAFLPVSVFVISKKYLNVKYALVSAMLFMSQTWFFEQMPALVRQEIAFLLYAMLLIVLFNVKLSERRKMLLLSIFSVGVVLSHYTTSYILIVVFGSIFLQNILSRKIINKKTNSMAGYILLAVIGFVIFWQVAVTNTGDAFGKFITLKDRRGLEVVATTTAPVTNKELQENIQKNLKLEDSELNTVYYDVVKQFLKKQDVTKYDYIEASDYIPKQIHDRVYSGSIFPGYLDSAILLFGKFFKVFMLVVLPIYGLYVFIRNLLRNRNLEGLDFATLNTVGIVLLSIMVLVPFLQIHYNITRLFLQAFITLSVFVIVGLKDASDKLGVSKILIVGAIALLFLFQSGFIGHFTGGYKRITIDTIPSDFYTFYIHDTEISSAKWLNSILKADDKIQSDNIANLRLQSFGDTNSYNTKVFPLSLRKDSFVYMIRVNVVDKMAVLQYNNISYMYEYPVEYIGNHKNLIYSNGDSIIFR